MGLNDIKLPVGIIAALYRNSFVEPHAGDTIVKEEIPVSAPSAETGQRKFLGDNRQQFMVAVNYPGCTHLPDDELSFLTNILAACKLNLGDIAIVNTANTPGDTYKDYKDFFKSKIVLLFGIEPRDFGLPVDFPVFQVQSLAGVTFLYAPALTTCREDSLLKSKLWVCLRRIFGI